MKLKKHWLVGLLAAAGMLAQAGSPLMAQQKFAQRPVPQNYSQSAATAAVKEAGPLSAQSKDAIKLMVDYYMSSMTDPRKSDSNRNTLENGLRAMSSTDGSKVAAEKVVEIAKTILDLRANYHPAVRVNAAILLADLDEGDRSSRTPSPEAAKFLFPMATAPNYPCHLRALALMGLERHIRAIKATPQTMKDIPARVDLVATKMIEIIASKPISIPEEKAHWWMVRRAYDVLDATQTVINQIPEKDRKYPPSTQKSLAQAMDLFLEPTTLPSVRLSAAKYLTHFDFATSKKDTLEDDILRTRLFVGIALLLDSEVVGWYEDENDKTRMQSGMGGMGGMGGGYGGMMGGGGGEMGGYGGMMGGGGGEAGGEMGGYGGMMGGGGTEGGMGGRGENNGPKPIDTQTWDLRQNRRKLNVYCQLAHALLEGNLADSERDYDAAGKGVVEDGAELPEHLKRPAKFMIDALEELQKNINEKTLTTTSSLMSRARLQLSKLREACEMIGPLLENPEDDKSNVLVPGFRDLSPRMQSFKKADMSGVLETPAGEAQPPKPQDGAPADAAAGADAPAGAAGAGQPSAPGNGQPGQPGAQPGQPGATPPAAGPAGATPAAPAQPQPGAAPQQPAAGAAGQ